MNPSGSGTFLYILSDVINVVLHNGAKFYYDHNQSVDLCERQTKGKEEPLGLLRSRVHITDCWTLSLRKRAPPGRPWRRCEHHDW